MYGTVAEIAASFPSAQWDPTRHEPATATVTAWLTEWSATLDGQLSNVVQTPVTEADSPNLYAICVQVTRLRVRADVYDAKWAPLKSEVVTIRQSQVWRKQADELVKGILAGGIADGIGPDVAGAAATVPTGDFGNVDGDIRGRLW